MEVLHSQTKFYVSHNRLTYPLHIELNLIYLYILKWNLDYCLKVVSQYF